MRHFNLTILIALFVTNFNFTSCNQTYKSDDREKVLAAKENELLKKENELLNKKQELYQKTAKTTKDNYTVRHHLINSTSNSLDFLKKLNGKYPYEAKLFDNSTFTKRLKKLLGNSRYNFLTETWTVESPMEFVNNVFVASGCQAHICSSTNFIIVVDFSKNVMYAGIREEGEVKTYSEDGSNSLKVSEWEY
jgi:hypothetical protein